MLAATLAACDSATIKANEAQVAAQQQQIEENQRLIAELKAQQPAYTPGVAPPPTSCDRTVADRATQNGGAKMAATQYTAAIGYYNDAVAACPNDAKAELNLARAYEAAGDRSSAIAHYRAALGAPNAAGTDVTAQASSALARMGANY